MAFDRIIACLEVVTDYSQFERFCADLMREDGYSRIEPLGGGADEGRDSVLRVDHDTHTVFCYSVRKDWKLKLWQDAARIKTCGHSCRQIVYVNPARFTTPERDECVREFKHHFKLDLELYGIERMASLLRSTARHLVDAHPQLFALPSGNEMCQIALEVRINSTRHQRRQLAQIAVYNKGPSPVLIDSWFASWGIDDNMRSHESIGTLSGKFPFRLEDKSRATFLVPLDFEWKSLRDIGLKDADGVRHKASKDNLKSFLATATRHEPPPAREVRPVLSLEEVKSQAVDIRVEKVRVPGAAHDVPYVYFTNKGEIDLETDGATLAWELKLPKNQNSVPGKVTVQETGTTISLERYSPNNASSNGQPVLFRLYPQMADGLVELLSKREEISRVVVTIHLKGGCNIAEDDGVIRSTLEQIAQSILDSWDRST